MRVRLTSLRGKPIVPARTTGVVLVASAESIVNAHRSLKRSGFSAVPTFASFGRFGRIILFVGRMNPLPTTGGHSGRP